MSNSDVLFAYGSFKTYGSFKGIYWKDLGFFEVITHAYYKFHERTLKNNLKQFHKKFRKM